MILAIETATPVCSVALRLDDGGLSEKRVTGKGIHSEMLFLFIRQLLEEHRVTIAHLEEVLISIGPGQYTGLRIGAAAVKGLLFGREIPLFSLGTLQGFAAGLICKKEVRGIIHSVADARRNHLYYQKFYTSSKGVEAEEPAVREISDINSELKQGDSVTGTGLERLEVHTGTGINLFGLNQITATNLVCARMDERFRQWFKEQDSATFEPEYLTSDQVNNTKVNQ